MIILVIFIFQLINHISFCAGITNVNEYNGTYIIDVSTEDIPFFLNKLNSFLKKVQNQYYIICTLISFLFIFTMISLNKICSLKFIPMITFSIAYCIYYIFPYSFDFITDYKLGIKSAKNAINNYYLTMKYHSRELLDYNSSDYKFRKVYVGDEIGKFGLHAVFCEIPGTLPSKKGNPMSYEHFIGGDCYIYSSQRRYFDSSDPSYVGDEIAKKYKSIQLNNLTLFFD